MEDKIIKEFVNFYDNESLKEYSGKIRTEIINGLEDLRKRDSNFCGLLFDDESCFFNNFKFRFKTYGQDTSKEEEKRLSNLIEIYSCLESLSNHNHCVKNEVNRIKSLVNGD